MRRGLQRPHTLPLWDPASPGLASGTPEEEASICGVWGPSPQTPYPSSCKVKDRSGDGGRLGPSSEGSA